MVSRNMQNVVIDPIKFRRSITQPGDPNGLITQSLRYCLHPLSGKALEFIKRSILLSGQLQDYYWTNAWDAFKDNPADMGARQIVLTPAKRFYKYIMNLPEYHLLINPHPMQRKIS